MIHPTPATSRGLARLRLMKLIRRFEERCVQAYAEQQIRGFLHVNIGEEAVASGIVPLLRPEDALLTTYREHGHALARGIAPNAIMAEMFGKQDGCSRGRGGSMHLFDKAARFYGGNAIVGGLLPVALGFALAAKMRKEPGIACCFFGEGAVVEGAFHEVMNLAALWQLPLLLVCENNLYAMGTRIDLSQAVPDLQKKAAVYGVQAFSADGMDVEAVGEAAERAIAHVRAGNGPAFLECRTYRFHGHSTADPQLYREKSEVDRWKQRDPLTAYAARLKERGEVTDADIAAIDGEVEDLVEQSVRFAQSAAPPPPSELMQYVYSVQPS